jgi:hypothetical protein
MKTELDSSFGDSGLSGDRVSRLPVKVVTPAKRHIVEVDGVSRNYGYTEREVKGIKHRPQENPSCVNAYGGHAFERGGRKVQLPLKRSDVYVDTHEKGIKIHVPVNEYQREYDNPDKPDTFIDANGKRQWQFADGYSNLQIVKDLVGIKNNPDNRKSAYAVFYADDYARSLRAANICELCKKPLKTEVTTPVYPLEDTAETRETIIADCLSHFEIFKSKEIGRYIFLFVDGTGRKIFSRKGKYGRSEFYLESGEVIRPQMEYRVERRKCACGLK